MISLNPIGSLLVSPPAAKADLCPLHGETEARKAEMTSPQGHHRTVTAWGSVSTPMAVLIPEKQKLKPKVQSRGTCTPLSYST